MLRSGPFKQKSHQSFHILTIKRKHYSDQINNVRLYFITFDFKYIFQ